MKFDEIEKALSAGKELFVEFDCGARKGSIGRITNTDVNIITDSWNTYTEKKIIVEWDGRNNKISIKPYNFNILENYTGITIWKYKAEPKKPPKDFLGRDAEVGCSVIATPFGRSSDDMILGRIERFTDKSVFVKSFNDKHETRCTTFLILDDQTNNHVMMAKLGSNQ